MTTGMVRIFTACMISLAGMASIVSAQDKMDNIDLAIVGGLLIDGNGGRPIPDSVVLVAGDRVAAVGTEANTPIPDGVQVIDADGMTVMPGLIDMHAHFDILGHSNYPHWFSNYEDRMRSDILPAAARIMLYSGITSVRDLGSDVDNIFWLRDQIESGAIQGPRAFIAGPFLRKTRTSFVSDDYIDTWVVEDPDDARRKVRRLVEMGVDLIKTQDENLSVAELNAIYDEAHRHNMPVATHLFSQAALRRSLEAGIGSWDTIEHVGAGPQPEYPEDIVQMIVEQQVAMAPTIIAEEGIRQIWLNPELVDDPDWKQFIPADLYADIRGSYDNISAHPLFHRAVYERESKASKLRQLYDEGAHFVVSSDSGTRGNPHHMATWREMHFMVEEIGMAPMEVIMAATKIGAQVLRRQNDLGTIQEGKIADVIIIDGNPLMTMSALANVIHVIKGGEIIR